MSPEEYQEKRQRLEKQLSQKSEQIIRLYNRQKQLYKNHLDFEKQRTAFFVGIGEMYCNSVGVQISEAEFQNQGDDYFRKLNESIYISLIKTTR